MALIMEWHVKATYRFYYSRHSNKKDREREREGEKHTRFHSSLVHVGVTWLFLTTLSSNVIVEEGEPWATVASVEAAFAPWTATAQGAMLPC